MKGHVSSLAALTSLFPPGPFFQIGKTKTQINNYHYSRILSISSILMIFFLPFHSAILKIISIISCFLSAHNWPKQLLMFCSVFFHDAPTVQSVTAVRWLLGLTDFCLFTGHHGLQLPVVKHLLSFSLIGHVEYLKIIDTVHLSLLWSVAIFITVSSLISSTTISLSCCSFSDPIFYPPHGF